MKKLYIRIIVIVSIFLTIRIPVSLITTKILRNEPITFDEFLSQSKLEIVEEIDYYPIEMVGENIVGEGNTEYLYDVLVASQAKLVKTSNKYNFSRFDNPKVEAKVYNFVYKYPYSVGMLNRTSRTIAYIEIPLLNYKENLPNQNIVDDSQKALIKEDYESYISRHFSPFINKMKCELSSLILSFLITGFLSSWIFERFSKDGDNQDKQEPDNETIQEG